MLVSSSVGFFTAFRMTCKEKYVILSGSEISHHQSEKYMPCGNPPSREIAAVVSLPRKDKKTNLASSFGGSVGEADDRGLSVILSGSEIFHRKSDA